MQNLSRWLAEPQYGAYLPELLKRVRDERFEELESLFWEVIPFGTGGRRGPMAELGSATINRRTIAESAHGLADYLRKQNGQSGGSAAIAHDTRNRSPEFARLTATTLAANGLRVYFFDGHRSTPELSFAVRHLGCDVGAMISASHNPPADNGFKAYWSNGAQVLPPHDQGIIDCVYEAGEIPTVEFEQAVADGRIVLVGEEVDAAYFAAVTALSLSSSRRLRAVFTPLHGVGETSVYRVFEKAGFSGIEIFEPQRKPDGNFTNVPEQLPNPERRAVFEPAIAHAKATGAGLVLASDPDADRLGAAVAGSDGAFEHLTGNQIAALLADYVLRKRAAAGSLSPEHYVVETIVTTPLVASIAASHGIRAFGDLLIGFKYIAETMDREGPEQFVFGAEESLGYLAGTYARDKDAAVAGLYLAELAAELGGEGKTLLHRLDELYREHGYHLEGQTSETAPGSSGQQQIQRLMRAFRESPPENLAGCKLECVRDYSKHEVRGLPANRKTADLPQPSGNLLFFDSTAGEFQVSVAVRPSGTEPKIKFYYFLRSGPVDEGALASTKQRGEAALQAVMQAFMSWVKATLSAN